MNPPLPHWERCESVEEVRIPSADRVSPPTVLQVKVPAWRDPDDGEIYLDGEAIRILDDVRARHLGLMTSEEIREMRQNLGLTQKRLSELLQIGEKTWTRWESGRDRPSKSLNLLICALRDDKIDVPYLERLLTGAAKPAPSEQYVTAQLAADIRWSDLLSDANWETIGTAGKWTTEFPGGEFARWIRELFTDSVRSNETGDWERSENIPPPNNIIPFQKAS
jgi:DNA-binding transcriptional regulator YiaG